MKMLMVYAAPLIAVMMFQQAPTPPMKMGLWEQTTTVKMSGASMPFGMPGMGPRTVKSRVCITPESYQNNFAKQEKNCKRSNEVFGKKGFSFDLDCGRMTGHFSATFDNDELGHTTSTMVSNSSHQMSMEGTGTTTFISSSCGDVTPDKPQIIK